jgi:hypothetical protein
MNCAATERQVVESVFGDDAGANRRLKNRHTAKNRGSHGEGCSVFR